MQELHLIHQSVRGEGGEEEKKESESQEITLKNTKILPGAPCTFSDFVSFFPLKLLTSPLSLFISQRWLGPPAAPPPPPPAGRDTFPPAIYFVIHGFDSPGGCPLHPVAERHSLSADGGCTGGRLHGTESQTQ